MRGRLALLATGALGVAAIALAWTSARTEPATPVAETSRAAPRRAQPASEPAPSLSRNPFEFGAAPVGGPASGASARPVRPPDPVSLATPPPPEVRLVGLVHRGDGLRAALSVRGELALVEVGGTVSGYTLLSADDDNGVRLRAPDGSELALAAEQP